MKNEILNLHQTLADHKDYQITSADKDLILSAMNDLDSGKIRVAEKVESKWITNEWVKKSILLYFRITTNKIINSGDLSYFDKIPVKKFTESNGVRVVPQAIARFGSFVEAGAEKITLTAQTKLCPGMRLWRWVRLRRAGQMATAASYKINYLWTG